MSSGRKTLSRRALPEEDEAAALPMRGSQTLPIARRGTAAPTDRPGVPSEERELPRKEVIQPHLPVQLPCYDFVPVTSPALGAGLLAVGCTTSSVTGFHDVTGGVYKARERIHRRVLTGGY